MDYKHKYLKYKSKYLALKTQQGGESKPIKPSKVCNKGKTEDKWVKYIYERNTFYGKVWKCSNEGLIITHIVDKNMEPYKVKGKLVTNHNITTNLLDKIQFYEVSDEEVNRLQQVYRAAFSSERYARLKQ